MKNNKISFALSTITLGIVMGISCPAFATEDQTPTPIMGLVDFGAGFLPPVTPMGLFATRTAYYKATTIHGGNGKDVPGEDFSMGILTVSAAYVKMTNHKLWGGNYGISAALPFFNMNGSLDMYGNHVASGREFNVGDLDFTPLIVAWKPSPNLGINTQFQIQMPTGSYDKTRFTNPGLNHWVFTPKFAVSYINDEGYEFSSSFELDVSTQNQDTNYTNGVEYLHQFAVGKHINHWTLGLAGYYYKQLSDDKKDGVSYQDGNRGKVVAIGPSIQFFSPRLPTIDFHAYKEFDAVNHAQGYNLALIVAQAF